jgi:hypothetical protein
VAEEKVKEFVAGVTSFFLSLPLWAIVLFAIILGIPLLLVLSPIIVAAGAAFLSWLVLERMGVRGPFLWVFPVAVGLLLSVPFVRPLSIEGIGGTIISWAAGGPALLVCLLAAAFAVLFLSSVPKVGMPGALMASILGAVLGFSLAAGVLGVSPSACSVSSAGGEAALPLWPVVGALLGGMALLLGASLWER